MDEFYEFLERSGLTPGRIEAELRTWDANRLLSFVDEARSKITYEWEGSPSRFGFVANSQLSGAPEPCASLGCRLERVDSLARFATLYADRVLLRDPFDHWRGINIPVLDLAQHDLFVILTLLHRLRPLVASRILGFARTEFNLCPIHGVHLFQGQEELAERLFAARAALERRFSSETQIVLDPADMRIIISGPESLVEHGSFSWRARGEEAVGKRRDARGLPFVIGKSKKEILRFLSWPVISDVLTHSVYSSVHRFNYFTDRRADLDVMRATQIDADRAASDAIAEGLAHDLPFMNELAYTDLLKVRLEEGESFRVYRDALVSVLAEVNTTDVGAYRVREAFNDVVLPELNRMDQTVRKMREAFRSNTRVEVGAAIGAISIGLFSGILSPSVAATVAAMGGLKVAYEVIRDVAKTANVEATVRDQRFYFLWKLRRQAERAASRPIVRTRP